MHYLDRNLPQTQTKRPCLRLHPGDIRPRGIVLMQMFAQRSEMHLSRYRQKQKICKGVSCYEDNRTYRVHSRRATNRDAADNGVFP